MKMFRKLVSVVAAATMLTSSLAFTSSAGAAQVPENAEVSADANLQKSVQDGVILHAFNWSYKSIKENLASIAAAGYSTVQTSPVQQPKDYSMSTDVAGQWWKLYQPVSMSIGKDTWLGTKDELKELCTEADKYGIKIICDIVSNHMGNQIESDPNSLSNQVKTYQPDFYSNKSSYFRSNSFSASDSSVQYTVQGHVSNCPDLNTGNTNVQNAVINLLKECIDCGVDGFRFDAAKHIETPSDGSYASQYWPNITNSAKTYYSQKNPGQNLYIYGEILNNCGPSSRSYSHYTNYINVTDNRTGDAVLAAVNNRNASTAASSSYKSGAAAKNIVLWAESHDTYEGNSGSAGLGNTSGVSDETVIKAWSIVAARKDATALFFARPGTAHMGEASTDASYKSTAVAEVNKFHNKFVGQSEKLGSSSNIAYVVRGNSGIVLANCGGTTASVNISGTGLANGTYTDTITGNTFNVSGGTITGNIGSTGVAVVYDGKTTPRATSSVESTTFKGETITVELALENAVSGTYCLDDSSPVTFTGKTAIKIGSDYNYGETINLTLTATDKDGVTESTVYRYTKTKDTSSGIYIWFNAARKTSWKEPFNVYIYDEDTKKGTTYTNGAAWPGESMIYDETQKMWYYEVPTTSYATVNGSTSVSDFDLTKSSSAYIIINGISKTTNQTTQYPVDGTAQNKKPKLDGKSWEYAVTGANSFEVSTRKPTAKTIDATEVTKGKNTEPTTTEAPTTKAPEPTTKAPEPTTKAPEPTTKAPEPTTKAPEPTTKAPEPTTKAPEPTTSPNTEPDEVYIYGDVNNDGVADVTDATLVQMHIAGVSGRVLTGIPLILADVDGDNDVDITDATLIQMYTAHMDGKKTGTKYVVPKPTQEPTKPQPTTQEPKPTTGKSLKVTATSNLFPQATTTFDPISDKVTVTYWINVKDYLMINSQWTLTYDKDVLEYDEEDGVNQELDRRGSVSNYLVFRATEGDSTTVNTNPKSVVSGGIKANATRLSGYYLTSESGGRVPFVSVTFKPKAGVTGNTTVNLDVEIIQLGDGIDERFYFVNESQLVRSDIQYMPSDTATAVYSGTFNPNAQQDPDDVQPTTNAPQPTTNAPQPTTEEPEPTTEEPEPTTEEPEPTTEMKTDPVYNPLTKDYYLIGYIDKKDYGDGDDYANFGDYHFDKDTGKVTATFHATSYVCVKDTDMQWYMTDGPQGDADEVTLYTTDITGESSDKMMVPAGEIEFTLVENGDGTLTLSYVYLNDPPYTLPDEDPTDPISGGSFLFTDNQNWGTVYVHAWDSDGNPITGDWPGMEVTEKVTNEFGETQFVINVPEGAVGLVLSNGNGDQTVDITNFDVDGYYTSTDRDGEGKLIVYYWPGGEKPDPGPNPNPNPNPGYGSFLFTDNQNWGKVYVHAWSSDGNPITGDWPGMEVTEKVTNEYGETQFVINVPEGAVGLVLSNGNGDQTVDITDFNVTGYYTKAGDKDSSGHFNVYSWTSGDQGGGDQGGGGGSQGSFLFTCSIWDTVYVHAWNDGGDLTQWPGNQMTETTTNGYGEKQFVIYVPEGATGVVLSNGNGDQTVDITDFNVTGYYITGSSDGKRTVDSWTE